MYLDSFTFWKSDKHVYPHRVLLEKQLDRIEFAPITISSKLEEHIREGYSVYGQSQFVIATHSPFLLAIKGAKVIDLDSCPSKERPWFELPNMAAYYQFIQKHAHLFDNSHEGQ